MIALTVEVDNDSYFYSLLKAHAAEVANEPGKSPSHYAAYGMPINILRQNITEYMYYGNSEKIEKKIQATISNIAYTFQLLEFYINAKNELYLSYPMERMLNKEILITSFEIQEALISIMFEGYYKAKTSKERILKLKNEEKLSEDFINALDDERRYRNKVHLTGKGGNPIPDYDIFDDTEMVNKSINLLNELFALRIHDDQKIVLPNVK